MKITAIFAVLIAFFLGTQSFLKPIPVPSSQGTTIKLLYSEDNVGDLIKVQFWGSVYPQGQDQWDDACPWYGNGDDDPVYFNCDDFCGGVAYITPP
ncbi:MAG: hypothetical protein U9N86_18070 [Bacteroidota bacterium]|nr:hypothetical protein [Bacteroidota bacterium]